MKILFVLHRLDYADHIAISHLSAIAKQLGHTTYFCNLENSDLSDMVARIKPDCVAYSVNIVGFKKIVTSHKEACKRHKFVSIMGGPHPTFSPGTFAEAAVDAYCIGEGDFAFRDFLVKVERGEAFDDVANIITRKKANPVRPAIRDLDELPPADRDLTIQNSFLKYTPKKTFYATRGCPFQCTYCCNDFYHKLYKGKGPLVRRFSVERIIREIENVGKNYRMDFVKFGDDLFAMKADDWLEEFAEKYPKRVGIPYNCYLRLDWINDDMAKLLKKSGCYSVHLSIDSTSEYVREEILKRKMKKVDIVETLKLMKSYGINTFVNFMLAVPGSSLEDDIDTIRVSRKAKITYANYTTTVPMEGTRLYDYSVEHDYIDSLTHAGDMTGVDDKSTLDCFSEKEKNVRFNIYLLGALIAKLPYPLDSIMIFVIKVIPPNQLFRRMRQLAFNYYIENRIFKFSKNYGLSHKKQKYNDEARA